MQNDSFLRIRKKIVLFVVHCVYLEYNEKTLAQSDIGAVRFQMEKKRPRIQAMVHKLHKIQRCLCMRCGESSYSAVLFYRIASRRQRGSKSEQF